MNEPMPVGWMIDKDGKPLTDAKKADEGHLLPIGDYKGSGLSLIIGLLAGALNRAAVGREVIDFVKETGKATNTGHAICALAIDTFVPVPNSSARSTASSATSAIRGGCPASSASGFPASRATPSCWSAAPAAFPCRSRCATHSMRSRATSASSRWDSSMASPRARRRHRHRPHGRGVRAASARRRLCGDGPRYRCGEECAAGENGRARGGARRYRGKMRSDRALRVLDRSGRGCDRARTAAGRRGQDRDGHQHLRSGPHRGARRARRRSTAFSRNAGVGDERAGAARRGRRPHRRRCADRGGGRTGARCAVPDALSHRQGRRRRARQACGQSHPWPQPPRARRRARVRRAARARSGGVFCASRAARQRHRR